MAGDGEGDDTDNETNGHQEQPSSEIGDAVPSHPQGDGHTATSDDDSDNPKRDGYDKFNSVMLFCGFIAAAAAAVCAGWLAVETRDALSDARRVAAQSHEDNEAALEAAYYALGTSQEAADTQHSDTRDSLRATNSTTEIGNRAWVTPYEATFNTVRGERRVDIMLWFQNTGHQPAMEQKIGLTPTIIELPKSGFWDDLPRVRDNLCREIPQDIPFGYQFPTAVGSSGQIYEFKEHHGQPIYWPSPINGLERGVQLKGCISYASFGKRHHTSFCYLFGPASDANNHAVKIGTACEGGQWSD